MYGDENAICDSIILRGSSGALEGPGKHLEDNPEKNLCEGIYLEGDLGCGLCLLLDLDLLLGLHSLQWE